MNDRYDGYAAGGGQGDQYELVGYDEFGQPVYRQVPGQPPQVPPQGYGSYGSGQPQGYGYDPYVTDQQPPVPPYDSASTGQQPPVPPYDMTSPGQQPPGSPYGSYDPYGAAGPGTAGPAPAPYDPYGEAAATGPQPRVTRGAARTAEQTAYIPQQGRPTPESVPREDREDRDYRTEQFSFVEEPDEDSEDVIDWLKFTESRTERREEARRRGRNRMVALVVVLALVAVGGVGYLWYAGKLPGMSAEPQGGGTAAAGAQNRDVIVVHLHNTKKGGTSTALLVDNTTTKQGTTVLLPNSLALTDDDGTTTTLAKSVDDDGSDGTRESLDTLLGTEIQGTWRLDTPYLNNLVELVGNIDIDTNADVPDPDAKGKKGASPLVKKGEDQTLSGPMAVAYATYRASGESENAQLERFGQVMLGVLRKMSSDPQAATTTVQSLAQILDPSLNDKDLGAFLAKLSDLAKGGDYKTRLLPVQRDGTLSEQATDSVVKDVLGGTVKSPEKGDAVRVGVKNATGNKAAKEQARVVLLNGGYTFVDSSGTGTAVQALSQVVYADAADKDNAVEVAKTLGLPTSAVKKGKTASNADVSVVLGQNYKVQSSTGTGSSSGTGTTSGTG
ncbi:LytR C-terminal domain-containing protein [Streptomyces jeddahensis]|uniref:Cell envelope-related transcriptional attenuator domain protein n=1 Tax=Streptomyces jeddahensis TaxID=1716141 RepID=A0A177HYN4_9ACTN|nr:LytR C-terminal domain-containing protein [Streptomyces jeddahensis]OAH15830.1 cell envelope-related transcriptional attenuator domain protein [Streptomyces jeddahensis]